MREFMRRPSTFLAVLLLSMGCNPTADGTKKPSPSTSAAKTASALENGSTLVLGSISLAPKEELATFEPFMDELATRLESVDFARGKVRVAESLEAMIDLLETGQVDLYLDSAFPVAHVCSASGARPLLRRWKKGFFAPSAPH